MYNSFDEKVTSTQIALTHRPFSVSNNNKKTNQVYQRLESNSYRLNKKKDYFSPVKQENKTFYKNKNKSDVHPLDFYALGKVPYKPACPNLKWNNAIKSTSNDIIYRNALSINTKKFNDIDTNKKLAILNEQNITENNYMEPIKTYQTYQKSNLQKYVTNMAMYRLIKEKYYSRDIHSNITKGKYLSRDEFMQQKEKIKKKRSLDLKKRSFNHEVKCEEKKSCENSKDRDRNDKNKSIYKSFSYNKGLIYKDPNDYSKQVLKNNTFYFDKNNNQMLKQKKWPFQSKK